jgi:pimeloyl-ACP methyl ester carboxylesterase
MWGWSAGGPYVLACAALLPDLVAAVASLASLAPNDADGLYDDDSRLLLTDPAAARAELDKNREQILAASVSEFVQGFESVMSPADAVVVTGEWAEFLAYSAREALTPGSQGWWDDDRSAVIPWGFELASISIPVLLMHGRQDWFVPVSHGEWLAAHIPAVTARFLPDDGHLTLVNRLGEVHSWLAEYL